MVRVVGALAAHERPGAANVTNATDATTDGLATPCGQVAAVRPSEQVLRRPIPSRAVGTGVVPTTKP